MRAFFIHLIAYFVAILNVIRLFTFIPLCLCLFVVRLSQYLNFAFDQFRIAVYRVYGVSSPMLCFKSIDNNVVFMYNSDINKYMNLNDEFATRALPVILVIA